MTAQPVWLGPTLVEAIHDRLLADYGGGAPGFLNRGGLISALDRPRNRAAYGDPDLCELAACYASGIVRNHPFVDGNKRTAWMTAYGFLARNGLAVVASQETAEAAILALASRETTEVAFAAWLRRSTRSRRPKPSKAPSLLVRYHRDITR